MVKIRPSAATRSNGCSTVEPAELRYGRLKWRMLLLVMICYASYYTGRQNFGFAAKYLASDLHLSALQLGTISAGLLLAYAAGGLVSGFLGDLVGARYVVTTGLLLSFVFNWTLSFGHSYSQILLLWIINGFAQAMGWSPCAKLVGNWWPKSQRGFSFGLLLFAASCSILLTYALCLASLQMGGWRYVFRIPVLLMLPAAFAFFFLILNDPADAGLDAPDPRSGPSSKRLSITEAYFPLLRDNGFLLVCGSIGCESVARYGLLVWIPIHLLGPDWRVSGPGKWLTLALPLGMALGAAFTGIVSDRFFKALWPRPIVLLMGAGAFISVLLYFTPKSNLLLSSSLLVAAGFCVYGPQAAYWSLGQQFGGFLRASTATGLMDASAYIFAAAGEVVIGRVVDWTGTTASIFPVVAATCLISSLLMFPLARRSSYKLAMND